MDRGDIVNARSKVISQLDQDRFKKIMEVAGIWQQLPFGIYEEDDSSFIFLPRSKWSMEYWSYLRLQLNLNFSIKKMEHIVEVMFFLRKQKDPQCSFRKNIHSIAAETKRVSWKRKK